MTCSNNENFEWTENISTGFKEIDDQHKQLFELGHQLLKSDIDSIKPYILNLYTYTRYHFKTEERIMAENNTSNLIEHKQIHEELIEKLNNATKRFEDNPEKMEEVKRLVFKWITEHICIDDIKTWSL